MLFFSKLSGRKKKEASTPHSWPLIPLFLLILPLCLLCGACRQNEASSFIVAPESGELCYRSHNGTEYIQLRLNHDTVEGLLLNTTENQVLIRSFTGLITPNDGEHKETRMQVSLTHADVSVDQTWRAGFEKDGIRMKYDANAHKYTPYIHISCDSVRKVLKGLERTILSYKSTGFIVPEGEPLCYEAVRPANGSYLLEYFQLWIVDSKVKGRGAGYYTGSPVWDFDFHGSLEKNTMHVTVNYRETGENAHTVMETWMMDPKTQRILIKSYPNSVLATREYVPADNKDFLNFVHSYFPKQDRVR